LENEGPNAVEVEESGALEHEVYGPGALEKEALENKV
jgi:hypothetical protein